MQLLTGAEIAVLQKRHDRMVASIFVRLAIPTKLAVRPRTILSQRALVYLSARAPSYSIISTNPRMSHRPCAQVPMRGIYLEHDRELVTSVRRPAGIQPFPSKPSTRES